MSGDNIRLTNKAAGDECNINMRLTAPYDFQIMRYEDLAQEAKWE